MLLLLHQPHNKSFITTSQSSNSKFTAKTTPRLTSGYPHRCTYNNCLIEQPQKELVPKQSAFRLISQRLRLQSVSSPVETKANQSSFINAVRDRGHCRERKIGRAMKNGRIGPAAWVFFGTLLLSLAVKFVVTVPERMAITNIQRGVTSV